MDLLVNNHQAVSLAKGALGSILYHDLFDYPLSLSEIIKWELGEEAGSPFGEVPLSVNRGFYFVAGRQGLILKRLMRRRISHKKFLIAKRAASVLKLIPSIKMVGVTGALAMENADERSDVDLLVITQKGTLWVSRLLALIFLRAIGFPTRRFGDKRQEDKLCLNMWLDEMALVWPKSSRNIYTAHEISQILPLVNKGGVYEEFLSLNPWVKSFWPNATREFKRKKREATTKNLLGLFEPLARTLQLWYMKPKITRETVTKRRALFHPNDWWEIIRVKVDGILQT